jgi:FtsH-binding integral membrane protein
MRPTPTLTKNQTLAGIDSAVDAGLRAHMQRVYQEMATALGVSGVVAWIFGRDLAALRAGEPTSILPEGLLMALYTPPLSWVVMFAPLVAVMVLGFSMYKMAPAKARMALYGFAALMGVSLASIFAVFTGMSIANAFFATAAALAAASYHGYTTQRNLSAMGTFLLMGVIALIVASILNIFVGSGGLAFAINLIAVVVFTALMAYDTQRVKTDYVAMRGTLGEDQLATMGTSGALSMYLNFVNVFISLLQLFGQRQ